MSRNASTRVWLCPRTSNGVKCRQENPSRKRNCEACGKPRPARRRASHLVALDASYEEFVTLNGGDHCAICGRAPSERRRLDRDHDHATGTPRGLLCARCNRALPSWMTAQWLLDAAMYLDRAAFARLADMQAAEDEADGRRQG